MKQIYSWLTFVQLKIFVHLDFIFQLADVMSNIIPALSFSLFLQIIQIIVHIWEKIVKLPMIFQQ